MVFMWVNIPHNTDLMGLDLGPRIHAIVIARMIYYMFS